MPYKNLPESEWAKMDRCVEEVQGKGHDKESAIAICYTSLTGKEYRGPSIKLAYRALGDGAQVYDVVSGVALKQCGTLRDAAQYVLDHSEKAHDAEPEAEPPAPADDKPSLLDRVLSALGRKEGRRNSSPDETRLQQIHDLAVENGAQCQPMIYKQANGRHRWVMLSSNAYQDRDGEIVTQAAQERDVARMKETGQYGPLRLWHLGAPDPLTKTPGPGADIGDCDYAEMYGRIRVESGTFRDERIAAAIKGRIDQWSGSLGFFHPLSQPDREGAFDDIQTFERSLLPRGKESNYLVSLAAIIKESEMTTIKEKAAKLAELLGDQSLADTVIKQVDATEKAAQERGLKYKQEAEAQPPADEIKPSIKQGAADEAAPKEEDQDKALFEKFMPMIEAKMKGMIEEALKGATKEYTEKEAGLTAQIKALESQAAEVNKTLKELTGDLPSGVKRGYRATQDEQTVTGKFKDMKAPDPTTFDNIFNWLAAPMNGNGQ